MPQLEPERVYHLHVKPGHTALYQGKAFGDRATLQAPGVDAERLLAGGAVELVNPDRLLDVSERPSASPEPPAPSSPAGVPEPQPRTRRER